MYEMKLLVLSLASYFIVGPKFSNAWPGHVGMDFNCTYIHTDLDWIIIIYQKA